MMGVHGNGLTSLVWMKPTPRSTVIEFFFPKGMAFDYEYTTRALGMVHYSVWDNVWVTFRSTPKRYFLLQSTTLVLLLALTFLSSPTTLKASRAITFLSTAPWLQNLRIGDLCLNQTPPMISNSIQVCNTNTLFLSTYPIRIEWSYQLDQPPALSIIALCTTCTIFILLSLLLATASYILYISKTLFHPLATSFLPRI